jgi:hypothetical protein
MIRLRKGNSGGIHHGAFEEGLDRINRMNRIIGIADKGFDMA